MPKPNPNETEEHFISRCIPQIIDEGKPSDQAAAICHSIWNNKSKLKKGYSMPMTHKVFESSIKSFDDKELVIEHFISTEQEDRSHDIVRADGMQLDSRPVVLKQHGKDLNTGNEPIAKPLSIKVATNDKGVKGILVKTQYYDGSKLNPPDNTGQRLYEKAKNGFMPYWSIGFTGEGSPRSGGGIEFTKWNLFEYSQVGVPDNVGAEVIKSMDAEDVLKQANEIITYGFETQKQTFEPDPNDDINELLKSYTKEEIIDAMTIKTKLKSIAERVKRELPWEAMRLMWFAMLDELAICDGTERQVKAIIKEMTELLMLHAVAFAMSFQNDNQEVSVIKSQIEKQYYDIPTAENAAPVVKPVVVPEIKTTAVINPLHQAVLGLVTTKKAQPQVTRFAIKKEDLQKVVNEAVSMELKQVLNKLKGKV